MKRQQPLDNNVRKLRKALLSGKYIPNRLLPYFVPKPNGKERIICVPTVMDRLVQRSLLHYLNEKGYTLDNPISYGFVRGNGVRKAATKAISYRKKLGWVYKADISAFFDEVNRDQLKAIVNSKIKTRSLRKLISLFIDTEIQKTRAHATLIRKSGIVTGVGLRQGMPISPYLANLYLHDFDKEMIAANIPMIRYADDIIAFRSNKQECLDLHDKCRSSLTKLELRLHDISLNGQTKTSISSPNDTVEFLGLGLAKSNESYQLIVTTDQLNSIKQRLYQMSKMDYCSKNGITISKLLFRLDNKIRGYEAAYDSCDNKQQLSVRLRDWREEVVRQIFDSFGIQVSQLTKSQKTFLEIETKERRNKPL